MSNNHQVKKNTVINPHDFHMMPFDHQGWLVLNDNWITSDIKAVYCEETCRRYKIIEHLDKPVYHLVPKEQRYDVHTLASHPELSNWRNGRFTRLKVEGQKDIKVGYHLIEVR